MLAIRVISRPLALILSELRRRNPSNPQYERLLSEIGNPAFAQPITSTNRFQATPSVQNLLGGGKTTNSPVLTSQSNSSALIYSQCLTYLIPGEGAAPRDIDRPPVNQWGDMGLPELVDFDFEDIDKVGATELKKIKKMKDDLRKAIRLRKDAEFAESNVY